MIKKKLYNYNFKFLKFFKQKKYSTLPKTALSSLCVIFLFYSAPKIIDYSNNKSLEYINNSKTVLVYTLDKKKMDR